MEETSKRNSISRKTPNYLLWFIVVAFLLAVVTFIVWIFTNGSTSYISTELDSGETSTLNCSGGGLEESFFDSDRAHDIEHNVKIIIRNGVLDDFSYVYSGSYSSRSIAENDMAVLHGKYNQYMDKAGVYREDYNPVFSLNDLQLRISIYVESGKMKNALAPILFLDGEEYNGIYDYDLREFEELYERKGFTCETQE